MEIAAAQSFSALETFIDLKSVAGGLRGQVEAAALFVHARSRAGGSTVGALPHRLKNFRTRPVDHATGNLGSGPVEIAYATLQIPSCTSAEANVPHSIAGRLVCASPLYAYAGFRSFLRSALQDRCPVMTDLPGNDIPRHPASVPADGPTGITSPITCSTTS